MTGEAQCEERKRTLGLAPHPHSFHPPQARVEVMSPGLRKTKGDMTHCFYLTPTQSTSLPARNDITILMSWCGSNKKKETLEKDLTVAVRLTLDRCKQIKYKSRAGNRSAGSSVRSYIARTRLQLGPNFHFSGESGPSLPLPNSPFSHFSTTLSYDIS